MSADAAIGSTSGTLNLTGGISMATTTARALYIMGDGAINITGTAISNGTAASWHRVEKIGGGTLTIETANTALTFTGGSISGSVMLHGGATVLSGAGGFNTAAWTTNTLWLDNGSILRLDNTSQNVSQRTTGGGAANYRAVTLATASLEFLANGGAASSETFGTLSSTWGGNTVTLNNAGAANATLTFASMASNVVAGGSVLRLASSQTFNATTNRLVFGTTSPTLTNGIIQRAVVTDASGVNFATHGGNNTPVTAYSGYVVTDGSGAGTDVTFTNVNGGTAYGVNASNVAGVFSAAPTFRLTADTATLSNPGLNFRQINALKLEGDNTDFLFGTSGGVQLALGSGNILSTGAGQTIGNASLAATGSPPVVFLGSINAQNSPAAATAPTFTSAEGGIIVASGASLTVNAAMFNAANVTKGLDGALTFSTKQYFNTAANYFTVTGGTVSLAGGENTLWQGVQGGTAGQHMAIGRGATLDLNGNSQMVGILRSPNGTAFAGSGGRW